MLRRVAAGALLGFGATNRRLAANAVSTPTTDILLDDGTKVYDFDLLVIGGGSGGLAAGKRAAELGAKVAICDYVSPSETRGTTWGLGGTCVNVGCIPKKLMHQASNVGFELATLAPSFGWGVKPAQCDWGLLRQAVTNYVRSLNFGYSASLYERNVEYLHGRARLVDPFTVECSVGASPRRVSARRILLATGGRPVLPDIPGAKEFGVTSDDIFRLEEDPKDTIVVGGSYVGLECAGFLHGIGRPTSVLIRSQPLRGFDQDMAERVVAHMRSIGVDVRRQATVSRIERDAASGRLRAFLSIGGVEEERVVDTVLFATGRAPQTKNLGLEECGVKLSKNGKVVVDSCDRTSVPHIYAIGDVATGAPELTPVAVKAGRLLAERLFNHGTEVMSQQHIPTTVFTPLEYSSIGLSESMATQMYQADIEVYHGHLSPLEWSLAYLDPNTCYAKMIVRKSTDVVLGFHLLAPNAGEIAQMAAVAMNCGARKSDFDRTIGIHPTVAEGLTTLTITKSSGESPEKRGC